MNTEQIKRAAKVKYLHTLAKETAKEKFESQLVITSQGGCWQVNQQLISFLSITKLGDQVVMLDVYENPVRVDRKKLLAECIDIYTTVMDAWLADYEEISSQR